MKIDLDCAVVAPGTGWEGNCIVSVQPGGKENPLTGEKKLIGRVIDCGGRTFEELPHTDEILVKRKARVNKATGEMGYTYRVIPLYGDCGLQEFYKNLRNGKVGY